MNELRLTSTDLDWNDHNQYRNTWHGHLSVHRQTVVHVGHASVQAWAIPNQKSQSKRK